MCKIVSIININVRYQNHWYHQYQRPISKSLVPPISTSNINIKIISTININVQYQYQNHHYHQYQRPISISISLVPPISISNTMPVLSHLCTWRALIYLSLLLGNKSSSFLRLSVRDFKLFSSIFSNVLISPSLLLGNQSPSSFPPPLRPTELVNLFNLKRN